MLKRFVIACWLTAGVGHAAAQGFGQESGFVVDDPVLRHLWALGMDSSRADKLAQVLLDSVGPRLTASPGMEAAQDWVIRLYQSWGIPARKEQYGTWRGWRRGITHFDLVAPRVRSLEALLLAWSPGTRGRTVRGDVVALPDLPDSAAYAAWFATVRGKFVLISFPEPTCRPDDSWERWATAESLERMRNERTQARREWNERVGKTGYTASGLQQRLDAAGAAGILTSNWPGGWGVMRVFGAQTERTPVLAVSCEDYGLLYRLAANGQGPVVQLAADAEFRGEVPVYNVLAEIRGSELPNEYVMLSAHFDSWDGSSGATDNGTGSVTMLEAMRILKRAYPNPRRTILVGHWSGEEQGLNGSRAFVADHPEIVNNLQALFNQDNGTGRIETITASGFVDASAHLASYLSRIPADITRHITFRFPGLPSGGGTDHAAFVSCGAPGFNLSSGSWHYSPYTWHTNRDTYDKIAFDEIRNNATLAAMLAYLASEDPERMPRTRRDVLPTTGSGQPMRWPECRDGARQTR